MYREILPLLLAARLAVGQDTITSGPQITASVSIRKELEYTLQRSCVQHCVWYNGAYVRSPYHHDWDDVGGELGCGWAPINGCYCNTKYASSATSYFNTCISYYCPSGEDTDPQDLVSALSLYNAYCATANGNPTKPIPEPSAVAASTTSQSSEAEATSSDTPSDTSSDSPSVNSISSPNVGPTQQTSSRTTSASAADATSEPKVTPNPSESDMASSGGSGGLSKGATIGIAVGASIGGVALIAAAVVLFLAHRRKALAAEKPPMGGIEGY